MVIIIIFISEHQVVCRTLKIDHFSMNFHRLSSFWHYFSTGLLYTKTILLLFTSVAAKVVDVYLAVSWLRKCSPLFTSTSVNNC